MTILYVNGDSHSAGAEAVNPHAFAEDDPLYWALGRRPHPDNERVSYGCEIANMMGAILHCDAESASSNDRIIRTTKEYLEQGNTPDLIIIGWSTWEREEWWDEETQRFWQVNAGGIGEDWPESIKAKYKPWIASLDYAHKQEEANWKIWAFDRHLRDLEIKRYYFNTYDALYVGQEFDFNGMYLQPYDREYTYFNWLKSKGFNTVNPTSYHFGPDAHRAWAEYLYQNLVHTLLTV